jgi:acyl phosphate:glycerol-3-phosphate acyltransferase
MELSSWVIFIVLLIGAYLLGSVPLAFLIPKWTRGIDLRQYGSGNIGFTNVAASTSTWLAIPVLIFDVGKGFLAVMVARWLGFSLALQGIAGIASVAGHNWSIFLKFNAGRGLLTTIGVIVALVPKAAGILILLSLTGIPFHLLSLTSLICVFSVTFISWFSFVPPFEWLAGNIQSERLALTLVFLALWLVTVTRRVTVPLSPLSHTVSKGRLLLNRFLFDRDISDRKLWLNRNPKDSSEIRNGEN